MGFICGHLVSCLLRFPLGGHTSWRVITLVGFFYGLFLVASLLGVGPHLRVVVSMTLLLWAHFCDISSFRLLQLRCLLFVGFSRGFCLWALCLLGPSFLLLFVGSFFYQWDSPVVSLVFFCEYGLSRGYLTLVSFGLWVPCVSFLVASPSYGL